ncbi:MAG: hypothetical protein AB7O52_09640 [Planctomycetota bacterium]
MNREFEPHPSPATLSLFHDGEGPDEFRAAIGEHIAACDPCQRELARLDRLSQLLRGLPERAAPASVLTGVRAAINETRPSGLDPIADLQVHAQTALTMDPLDAQRALVTQVPRRYGAVAALFVVATLLGLGVWWNQRHTANAPELARFDREADSPPESSASAPTKGGRPKGLVTDGVVALDDKGNPRGDVWTAEMEKGPPPAGDPTARAGSELPMPEVAASEAKRALIAEPTLGEELAGQGVAGDPSVNGALAKTESGASATRDRIVQRSKERSEPNDSVTGQRDAGGRLAGQPEGAMDEGAVTEARGSSKSRGMRAAPSPVATPPEPTPPDANTRDADTPDAKTPDAMRDAPPALPTVAYLEDAGTRLSEPGYYVVLETPEVVPLDPTAELKFSQLILTCDEELQRRPPIDTAPSPPPSPGASLPELKLLTEWPVESLRAQRDSKTPGIEIEVDRAQLPAVLAATRRFFAVVDFDSFGTPTEGEKADVPAERYGAPADADNEARAREKKGEAATDRAAKSPQGTLEKGTLEKGTLQPVGGAAGVDRQASQPTPDRVRVRILFLRPQR